MANYCVFGVAVLLLLAAIPFSRVDSYGLRAEPLLLEFGTFAAADRTCLYRKIFKGQPSPVTINFNNPSNTLIDYIKVEVSQGRRKGGVTGNIIRGAVGTVSVSLSVTESSGKSTFQNDAQVTILCAPN
ncbi:uncharacterized protein LOC129724108 [Wyeomyia smithii]|uniref:uncharacterized protein LOC129724108 n=1 Tax=Wyeomyia smithii TaxID=174621 RepID=UPI002467B1BB|nr:uncharacterized protein LOC129724108 [Wyeomyia smithii]